LLSLVAYCFKILQNILDKIQSQLKIAAKIFHAIATMDKLAQDFIKFLQELSDFLNVPVLYRMRIYVILSISIEY